MSTPSAGSPTPPHSNPPGGFFASTVPVAAAEGSHSAAATTAPTSSPKFDSPPQTTYAHGISGSSGSESAGHVSDGKKIEQEIQARLDEVRQYKQVQKDFGEKPASTRPVYPAIGYRLVKPIGAGTYGSVWEAHPEDDDIRSVAIKFFPRRHGSARELMADTRHLKRLTNENGFVQLLDVNTAGEWPYFVMTCAERSLQQEIDERGPLPVPEATNLFVKLVKAMAHAHAKKPGVCHCDLKPSNVLLNDQHMPLVSDFGQSRLLDDRDRAALGTFFFMPPEQADLGKETPDSRWDVYALGAIFYQMVNPEKRPPRTEDWEKTGSLTATKRLIVRLATYREHLKRAPQPLAHRRAPGMDRRLADIVDRCLQLEPEKRFADAGAIAEALRQRQRARRRMPVLRLGVIATVVIFVLSVVIAGYFRKDVVEQNRDTLTAQIRSSQKETAFIAARLLEDKLRHRVNFLERAVPLPGHGPGSDGFQQAQKTLGKAVDKTKRANGKVLANLWLERDRKPVNDWLRELAVQADKEKVFAIRGFGVAANLGGFAHNFSLVGWDQPDMGSPRTPGIRSPWEDEESVDLFSRNFSWRDWFANSGYTKHAAEHGNEPAVPVSETHVSVVYKSGLKDRWIIDITRPIVRGPGSDEVIGMLNGGIDLQEELVKWMEEADKKQKDAGIEKGDSDLLVINERGILVWRRKLPRVLESLKDAACPVDSVDKATYMAQKEREIYRKLTEYGPALQNFLNADAAAANAGTDAPLFDDPWDEPGKDNGAEYIASEEDFFPIKRFGTPDKAWHVVVLQKQSDALKSVDDLERQVFRGSLQAMGALLGVAGLLWAGVFWMLRRTEGSLDG